MSYVHVPRCMDGYQSHGIYPGGMQVPNWDQGVWGISSRMADAQWGPRNKVDNRQIPNEWVADTQWGSRCMLDIRVDADGLRPNGGHGVMADIRGWQMLKRWQI